MIRRVTPKHTQAPTVKRLAAFALVLMLLLLFLPATVAAAEAMPDLKFDETYVMDDLTAEGAVINGEPFDIRRYPYDEKGTIQSLTFTEYCYSPNPALQANYGLYVYIYNPAGLNINLRSDAHRIQLANSYDANGNPTGYMKYPAECLSISRDKDNDELFAKFKVTDPTEILARVSADPLVRRYDVSGIEIHLEGGANARDYRIGGTYTFSGYAPGYGDGAEFASSYTAMDTLQLTTKHMTFRTETSAKGRGFQNSISSVYFSIPDSIMEKYGDKASAISAEWYEYKTKEIVVTSDQEFYDAALPKLGVQMPKWSMEYAYQNPEFDYALVLDPWNESGGFAGCSWSWNNFTLYPPTPLLNNLDQYETEYLQYLFFTNNIENYDPSSDKAVVGGVESTKLYEYMLEKSKYAGSYIDVPGKQLSTNLFLDKVDTGRTRGYNNVRIKADDNQNILSYNAGKTNWWENSYGWLSGLDLDKSYTVIPIEEITEGMLSLADEDFSEKYLIDLKDVTAFKDYCKEEYKNGGRVHILRFAVTDYFALPVDIVRYGWGNFDGFTKDKAYMAQESVFLNFDIIDVEFFNGTVYTTIPVVSDPIDIVADITPPRTGIGLDFGDGIDWKTLLIIIAIIIIVIILLAVFAPGILLAIVKGVAKGIVVVVTAPFKLIQKIFNKIRGTE